MPKIRGLISADSHKLGHFDGSPGRCWNSSTRSNLQVRLAALGTSCPDHFLRTKIRPLVIGFDPAKPDVEAVIASASTRRSPPIARRLRRLLQPLEAPGFAGPARPQRRGLPDAGRRHADLRQGQGHRPHRRRVLRQRHQRDARGERRRPLRRPARAGGFRHRVLAARGGQAATHAEAEVSLAGQVAFVTGGAGSIGRGDGAARLLARRRLS